MGNMSQNFYDAFQTAPVETEEQDTYADPIVDEPTPEPKPEPEAKPKRTAARKAPARRRPAAATNKATIDTILEAIRLSREVADYSDSKVRDLASMLNIEEDRDRLAAAIATGAKADTSAIESVIAIADVEDKFEAGIRAHQLTDDRKAFAKVWALVGRYADLPADAPRSNTEAALKLANAIDGLSAEDVNSIESIKGLLSR